MLVCICPPACVGSAVLTDGRLHNLLNSKFRLILQLIDVMVKCLSVLSVLRLTCLIFVCQAEVGEN